MPSSIKGTKWARAFVPAVTFNDDHYLLIIFGSS
jgi:hypothetical protein